MDRHSPHPCCTCSMLHQWTFLSSPAGLWLSSFHILLPDRELFRMAWPFEASMTGALTSNSSKPDVLWSISVFVATVLSLTSNLCSLFMKEWTISSSNHRTSWWILDQYPHLLPAPTTATIGPLSLWFLTFGLNFYTSNLNLILSYSPLYRQCVGKNCPHLLMFFHQPFPSRVLCLLLLLHKPFPDIPWSIFFSNISTTGSHAALTLWKLQKGCPNR